MCRSAEWVNLIRFLLKRGECKCEDVNTKQYCSSVAHICNCVRVSYGISSSEGGREGGRGAKQSRAIPPTYPLVDSSLSSVSRRKNKQTNKQTNRQTDRHRGKLTDKQKGQEIDRFLAFQQLGNLLSCCWENIERLQLNIQQLVLSGECHVNCSDTCPIKDKSPSKCPELTLYNKHLFAINERIQRVNTPQQITGIFSWQRSENK